jgi:hypothetical protein
MAERGEQRTVGAAAHGRPYALLARLGLFLLLFAGTAQLFRAAGLAYPEIKRPPEREGDSFYVATDGFAYDHIRYMFEREGPAAEAGKLDVVFLGNSRVMLGISHAGLEAALAGTGRRAHMMGFQGESHSVAEFIIENREDFRPGLVIINADQWYFQPPMTAFAALYVKKGTEGAMADMRLTRRMNRLWRLFQVVVPIPQVDTFAWRLYHSRLPLMWRSERDGDWAFGNWESDDWQTEKVVKLENEKRVEDFEVQLAHARTLVETLRERGSRVLFITVPSPNSGDRNGKELAEALGVTYVEVPWEGFTTFDASHLDRESAYRYTTELMKRVKETDEWGE